MRASASSLIQHIPGSDGLPIFGETFGFLKNPYKWTVSNHRRHGPVFRTHVFFQPQVVVSGLDFAESFLVDKEQIYSSAGGWEMLLGDFFGGGLLLRDFDVHRLHRRVMQVALKREALAGYLALMSPIVDRALDRIHTPVFPWIKQTVLDLAAEVFLGIRGDADLTRVNRLFTEIMEAVPAAFRWDVPGTTYGRGMRARNELRAWLRSLIPIRRSSVGRDMLSVLCTATDESGMYFTDDEILDHMLFLLMAAHDTTSGALTNLLMELGLHKDWQDRLREESRAIGDSAPSEDSLANLPLIYAAFREVLRLYPAVRMLPRRTLRAVEINGYKVPADTQVWLNVEANHRDPSVWQNPDTFDPERFSDVRAEHKRHRYAWTPFGGGAHICVGMQFSELQVKLLMQRLLSRYSWTAQPSELRYLPFIRARNGLPLTLRVLSRNAG